MGTFPEGRLRSAVKGKGEFRPLLPLGEGLGMRVCYILPQVRPGCKS
jgi:hypothetical protein